MKYCQFVILDIYTNNLIITSLITLEYVDFFLKEINNCKLEFN